MEAVAGITDRILQIQSRIASLSAPATRQGQPVLGVVGGESPSFAAALEHQVLAQGSAVADRDQPWVLNPAAQMMPATSLAPAGNPSALGLAGGRAGGVSGVGAVAGPAAAGAVAPGSGKGAVNARGVPVELLQYGNGKVPASALSTIENGNGHRLWTPAARSFEALRAAAARDGVTIGITDSYRTYESQVDLVRRKGLYSQGGLAASPGTSNHGWGLALDLRLDGKAQAWMRANAGQFGFVEDVPREPWHWTYRPTH